MTDDTLTMRFEALADPHDDSDWLDVVHRAGDERRRSRAWLALPLAAALVALVVGSAFAYYADVLHFGSAEKAPPETVVDFEEIGVGAPPGMNPEAIASEARRIPVTTSSGASNAVFVAPTRAGGVCYFWQRAGGGGCDKHGTVPLSVGWWAHPTPTNYSSGVAAHVSARYVSSVELRFSDGRVLRPPITWVSEPIAKGFFFHRFADRDRSHDLTVVALDDEGRVVTEDGGCCRASAPQGDALVPEASVAVSMPTTSDAAVIWTAPTRYEGICAWLEFAGQTRAIGPCMPKDYGPPRLAPKTHPTQDTVLIFGASAGRPMDLRYADGTVQHVTPNGDYYVVEIPREHLRPATRLVASRYADADPQTIEGRWHPMPMRGPGRDACDSVLPLPPGTTCP